jgi:hypothetical protein
LIDELMPSTAIRLNQDLLISGNLQQNGPLLRSI